MENVDRERRNENSKNIQVSHCGLVYVWRMIDGYLVNEMLDTIER